MIRNILLVLIIIIVFNKLFKIQEHFGGLFNFSGSDEDENIDDDINIDLSLIKNHVIENNDLDISNDNNQLVFSIKPVVITKIRVVKE